MYIKMPKRIDGLDAILQEVDKYVRQYRDALIQRPNKCLEELKTMMHVIRDAYLCGGRVEDVMVRGVTKGMADALWNGLYERGELAFAVWSVDKYLCGVPTGLNNARVVWRSANGTAWSGLTSKIDPERFAATTILFVDGPRKGEVVS